MSDIIDELYKIVNDAIEDNDICSRILSIETKIDDIYKKLDIIKSVEQRTDISDKMKEVEKLIRCSNNQLYDGTCYVELESVINIVSKYIN